MLSLEPAVSNVEGKHGHAPGHTVGEFNDSSSVEVIMTRARCSLFLSLTLICGGTALADTTGGLRGHVYLDRGGTLANVHSVR